MIGGVSRERVRQIANSLDIKERKQYRHDKFPTTIGRQSEEKRKRMRRGYKS
jgi:hypothetical protein